MYCISGLTLIGLGLLLNLDVFSQESITTLAYNTNLRENYDDLENLNNLNYDTFNITHSGSDRKEEDLSNVLHEMPVQLRYLDIITNISSAKILGLTENLETEFDITPLRVKLDKNGNVIFSVHVKTGPHNKLIGFGTKRVYVQVHSTNNEHKMETELIKFMSKILLVNPINIKFKRGAGRHLKKIIVPVSSITANLVLKKLIETFKLARVETFENGTFSPIPN